MPLPLLFIGIAAVTGLFGAGKSIKAVVDIHDAKGTNAKANSILQDAKERLEKARNVSNRSLNSLGREKLDILHGTISDFINWFGRLKNVDFRMSSGLNELTRLSFDKQELKELKKMGDFATSVLSGIGGGALGGAITAFGAYGIAGHVAAASTGTLISSLSGAAATNATLAFFGGGSLATGGLGMAGGTAVLGGLVAGPALAIMGLIVGAKASTELNKAKENLANASRIAREMNLASDMCRAIAKRADLFKDLLCKLDKYTNPLISNMKDAITEHGNDYTSFDINQKMSVAACVASIKAIKAVLDTPILTKEGNLTNESFEIIQNTTPESIIEKMRSSSQKSYASSSTQTLKDWSTPILSSELIRDNSLKKFTKEDVRMCRINWDALLTAINERLSLNISNYEICFGVTDWGNESYIVEEDLIRQLDLFLSTVEISLILESCSVPGNETGKAKSIDWECLCDLLKQWYQISVIRNHFKNVESNGYVDLIACAGVIYNKIKSVHTETPLYNSSRFNNHNT